MFFTACGAAVAETDQYCGQCGTTTTGLPQIPPAPKQNSGVEMADIDENTIRRLADYERMSGYFWIVLGVLQIIPSSASSRAFGMSLPA